MLLDHLLTFCGLKKCNPQQTHLSSHGKYLSRTVSSYTIHKRNDNVNTSTVPNRLSVLVSWGYSLFVLSMLSIKSVLRIKDRKSISVILFSFVPILQYALGVIYHTTNHFDFTIDKNHRYKITRDHIFAVSVIMGTLESSGYLYLKWEDVVWYEILGVIYGDQIVSVITYEFWYIFYTHIIDICVFSKKVQNSNEIHSLLRELVEMKFELDTSLDLLKGIFVSTSLICAIPLGQLLLCVKDNNCDLEFPYGYTVCFVIYQITFFLILRYIDHVKEDIVKNSKYIKHVKHENRYTSVQDSIDWLIFKQVLAEDWSEIKIVGLSLSNGEILKTSLVLTSAMIILQGYF